MTQRERAGKTEHRPVILLYHPRNGFDRWWREVKTKARHGFRVTILWETEPHEHPQHGRIGNTSIRNGTTLFR